MIIDIHIHYRNDLDTVIASAVNNRIDKVCMSNLGLNGYLPSPSPEEITACNDATIAAMKKFPDKIIGFCYLNPCDTKGSMPELERCLKAGMKGVKLWIACKASDPRVFPIAEHAGKSGVFLQQHAFLKTTGNHPHESAPADVAVLAEKFPGLTIIAPHLTGLAHSGISKLASFPNVYLDTSGGWPATGITEYAIKTIGPERLLFGSDAPGRSFEAALGVIFGANLTQEERKMILYDNARKLLKL